jgi:hypothetical protein
MLGIGSPLRCVPGRARSKLAPVGQSRRSNSLAGSSALAGRE